MKTINIKGKEYVTVNERLKEFRNNFKDYSLVTEIVELGADFATVKAAIIDNNGVTRATGLAREVVAKSPINKYAFLENCETSAMGRALGNFGIGIDDAICTAEELLVKMSQEEKPEKSDFAKEAAAAKAAQTKAINKAIAAGASNYEQPKPQKPLSERYEASLKWLKEQTPETYREASKSKIDYVNNLCAELNEKGAAGWLDNIMSELNRLTDIKDNIPY